jgi:dTDP-glucose 4,6-dehydratase
MKILVTGGAGFIGSAFCRMAAGKGYRLVVCDKLTYCGDLTRLNEIKGKFTFYKADISDKSAMRRILKKERPAVIVNFAAETHVDRSITDASPFVDTNIKGTQVLLDACMSFSVKRFVHLSTDEVYGEIVKGSFTEKSVIQPNSPYSASKASADLLIRAYMRTFGLPALIVRPSNNYGPWQFPEKLIPVMVANAIRGKQLPVYAKGLNRREWLYVDDCCRGILTVMLKGRTGEVYNIGSGDEQRNIDVVKDILRIMKKPGSLISFVKDRPGHDFRYSLDCSKLRKLGWKPQVSFKEGLLRTVAWYCGRQKWLFSHKTA